MDQYLNYQNENERRRAKQAAKEKARNDKARNDQQNWGFASLGAAIQKPPAQASQDPAYKTQESKPHNFNPKRQPEAKGSTHGYDFQQRNQSNNKNAGKGKPPTIFLKDLLAKENSSHNKNIEQANRDKTKFKKQLLPLLTFVIENHTTRLYTEHKDKTKALSESDLKTISDFEENIFLIIKKRYDDLSPEAKVKFLGEATASIQGEAHILREKFSNLLSDALTLVGSFRNYAMHKSAKENPFTYFKFEKFNGSLFQFLRLNAEAAKQKAQKEQEEFQNKDSKGEANIRFQTIISYWNSVLSPSAEEFKADKGNIPLIYVLAAMALFIEAKEMEELLVLTRFPGYISSWVKQFCLRGGFKAISPGIFQEDKNLELHRLQINNQTKTQEALFNYSKRITRTYDHFTKKGKLKPEPLPPGQGTYYQKLLRYHSFSNSYPEIPEFENLIKNRVAEEIATERRQRIKNIEDDNKDPSKIRRPVPDLETRPAEIKKQFTNIFRRGDTFLREAMAFLEDHDPYWFGNNWRIVGNAVIWYEPLKTLEFDVRRKTKPSFNAVSSIYKIRYNANNQGRIISIGRSNLQALLAAVLFKNTIDFAALRDSAQDLSSPQKKVLPQGGAQKLWERLSKECTEWNRYKQAQLVLKYIRKFMNRMHLNESIELHKTLMFELYQIENHPSEVKAKIRAAFTRQGIACPGAVENVLTANTLESLCQKCCLAFGDLPKKSPGQQQSHQVFYTWPKYSFALSEKMDPLVRKALGWSEAVTAPLFDIFYGVFVKNEFQLPRIIDIYIQARPKGIGRKNIKLQFENDKKAYRRELEIRSLLTEEFLFNLIARAYRKKIINANGYIVLTSSPGTTTVYSPTACNLIWKLNPEIELSFEHYHKKDVKSALNWIFDKMRLGGDRGIAYKKLSGDKAIAQECLDLVYQANQAISEHPVLGKKAPKYEFSSNYYNADDIKALVKRILWAQKEMLFFACDIERDLIYKLSQADVLPPEESGGYYNFTKLVVAAVRKGILTEAVGAPLIGVRNMLAHGKLYSYDIDKQGREHTAHFREVFGTIDKALKALNRKSLKEHYANVGKKR